MADYPDHLSEGIAELSRLLVNEEALDDTLQRVADLACRNIGGADVAGVTMLRDGKPTTTVYTDPTSPQIDSAQYETGVGPCLDASGTNWCSGSSPRPRTSSGRPSARRASTTGS
jgi:hypothetical protein